MKRYRLTGALAIAATASIAIPAVASATDVSLTGACELRDGEQALVVSYQAQGWPLGSRLDGAAARDGAVFFSGGRPTSSALAPNGYSLPEGLEFVSFLPSPQPSVHATAHISAYLPGNPTAYREAVLDTVYACPAVAPITPPGTAPLAPGPRVEPLPKIVAPPKAQRPRCALPKGAGRNWYIKRGCALPKRFLATPRAWAVTGEYRHHAQSPNPAMIIYRLLDQVPALTGDVPFASSVYQSANGKTASGGVTSVERGRLVPLPVPGHPWTSVTRGPKRTVACSASWISGKLRVSVLYAARAGSSDMSVAVRPR